MGRHALLQGIFLTQRSNPGLPHCRQILYQLSHQRSPGNLRELYEPYDGLIIKMTAQARLRGILPPLPPDDVAYYTWSNLSYIDISDAAAAANSEDPALTMPGTALSTYHGVTHLIPQQVSGFSKECILTSFAITSTPFPCCLVSHNPSPVRSLRLLPPGHPHPMAENEAGP